MKRMVALFLLAGVAVSCAAQGTTQTVFPYGFENRVGAGTDFTFDGPTDRQQWFRSSYLAQTWDTPVLISGVAFRVDEAAGPMNTIIPQVEIWFATSQRDSTDLQTTFGENAGPDARRVFAADSVALSSPGGSRPNEFGIRFSFEEPFRYDPQAGHLLMRIVTSGAPFFQGGQIIDLDGFFPLATSPMAIPGIGPIGSPSPYGIVTQISWVAVPESSAASLLGLGLAFVFFTRK